MPYTEVEFTHTMTWTSKADVTLADGSADTVETGEYEVDVQVWAEIEHDRSGMTITSVTIDGVDQLVPELPGSLVDDIEEEWLRKVGAARERRRVDLEAAGDAARDAAKDGGGR